MHTLLFRPDDVLFFRDGRPMGGASSGQGARFPEPHVLNSALHAACHRAFGDNPSIGHSHGYRNRQRQRREERTERFGSLRTCGPFPVNKDGKWHFPMPLDLAQPDCGPHVAPVSGFAFKGCSSLQNRTHVGFRPLASNLSPSKDESPDWLDANAFRCYLRGEAIPYQGHCRSRHFFSAEHTIGIELDPENGTAREGLIYSKAQLRFRENCHLGALLEIANHRGEDADLVDLLFPGNCRISLGGEARQCTVTASRLNEIPLPMAPSISGTRVKWVLLSPAIFPHLPVSNKRTHAHPGGWLPSWVHEGSFRVELLDGPGGKKAQRLGLPEGKTIKATLVAARIGKPQTVTGWVQQAALGAPEAEQNTGAKSTHLAVPAGSVYYFEADSEEEARKLADALNWHGSTDGTAIVNRRSTLLGEKGYGLGVCGAWEPFAP